MRPYKLYSIDDNVLLAHYLHNFSLNNRLEEIVLGNHFLQEWLSKEKIYENNPDLKSLEEALRKFFPECHQSTARIMPKELVLPCCRSGRAKEFKIRHRKKFKGRDELSLSEMANYLGFSE